MKMNYEEALEYIHSVTWKGSRPGLERIRELLSLMGDPHKYLTFVHVAGTNGKGSVCAMLESVLRASGYRTGMFVSPYIESFNERIQVCGEMIDNETLAEVTEYVKPLADSMSDLPTEFELITAIGFEIFRRKKCDIVVLEVGMGGRLDSTNIIESPEVSVITSISLDHTAFLGDTKEKIAYEKAGIIKTAVPVVYGGDEGSVEDVIRKVAKEKSAEFYRSERSAPVLLSSSGLVFDCGRFKNLTLPLAGLYQLANAATVLKTVFVLEKKGYKISEESIRRGLALTRWSGRFERLSARPPVYYDGGHNIDGVTYAAKTVKEYFTKNGKSVNLVFGVMADKDWKEMVRIIAPLVKKVFCVVPDNPRALDGEELAKEFSSMGATGIKADSFEDAIREAVKDADVTLALGSLYMYSQVKAAVKRVL